MSRAALEIAIRPRSPMATVQGMCLPFVDTPTAAPLAKRNAAVDKRRDPSCALLWLGEAGYSPNPQREWLTVAFKSPENSNQPIGSLVQA